MFSEEAWDQLWMSNHRQLWEGIGTISLQCCRRSSSNSTTKTNWYVFRICHLALLITAIVNIRITIIMPKDSRLVWPFKNTSTTLDTHQPHCSGNWHPEIELLIKNIMFGCTIVLTWQFCLKKTHFSALGGPEVAIFGRYDLGSFKHFVFAYLCVFVIV